MTNEIWNKTYLIYLLKPPKETNLILFFIATSSMPYHTTLNLPVPWHLLRMVSTLLIFSKYLKGSAFR